MKKLKQDLCNYKFNRKCGIKMSKMVVPSIMAQFKTVKCTYFDGDEKKEATSYVDDIYLLFNQNRIRSAGTDTINAWLETMQPRKDPLAELRSKCTDEQLVRFCKSRYIQSQSELLAWSGYIQDHYEDILAELASQSVLQNVQQTEPAPPSQSAPQAQSTSE